MLTQLKAPDITIKANAGWCLWHTQEVFKVPHYYRSATEAYSATKFRHAERQMPNVAVPVWFSHWGTYGTPPTYDNWGHVVTWVPSVGKFLSVAGIGNGQQWFNTIEEIERYFNAKYLGWTEDISGVRVVNIEGENMVNDQDIINIFNAVAKVAKPGESDIAPYRGKPFKFVFDSVYKWARETERDYFAYAAKQTAKAPNDAEKKLQALKDALNAL